ncbi:hypothetical protein FH5T_03700 [Draconibacterium orientale]|uniref:CarboxypepD_reg-like domain-containing protein n=1 Tax=Draconibacterium orientale TaxID=1168034 RepID=A0ABN4D6J6_9BACT|nr:hypothetical protein [Draconibacterium orientale]AHW61554.1 hypothetical protein FH5T_03700 [Draconibacterium orientale]
MTKRIQILLIGFLITLTTNAQVADTILVIGQLTSKDKNPLPGVSIGIPKVKNGTVSDVCGRFEIKVPIEGVINFSMISEPYYISMNDIAPNKDTMYLNFQFDLKAENFNCDESISKFKRIKLNEKNRDTYSQKLLACFTDNFEKHTLDYYNHFKVLNQDFLFVINGHVMDDDFSPENLMFNDFKKVYVYNNYANNRNILIIISMNDNGRKEWRK